MNYFIKLIEILILLISNHVKNIIAFFRLVLMREDIICYLLVIRYY